MKELKSHEGYNELHKTARVVLDMLNTEAMTQVNVAFGTIVNEIKDTFSINLVHKLTLGDNVLGKPGDYRYSTEIELSANSTAENFEGWKITDAKGNEVDLGIADLTATEITFTMPDCDLFVEAMYQKDEPADDNGGLDIDNIFGDLDLDNLTQGDSDNPIENLINNIIALFKNIIEKITGFFRAIGDRT